MKKFFCVMCVGFFILLFFACSSKHTSYNNNDIEYYGGNPMEFKSFKLVQTNMSAQQYIYEGYKTENGDHLEYYISTENWDYKMDLHFSKFQAIFSGIFQLHLQKSSGKQPDIRFPSILHRCRQMEDLVFLL